MRKHREAVSEINSKFVPSDLYAGAKQAWDEAVELGEDFGYRNAQATVLAPTGTSPRDAPRVAAAETLREAVRAALEREAA